MKAKLFSIVAIAGFLTGCATLERTSPGMLDDLDIMGGDTPAKAHVLVHTSGTRFFYHWPIAVGDLNYDTTKHDVVGSPLFFTDQHTAADCYLTLQKAADCEGYKLTNVHLSDNRLPELSIGMQWILSVSMLTVEHVNEVSSGVFR